MRLFIPALNTRLRLLDDWTFEISRESNYDLIATMAGFGSNAWGYGTPEAEARRRIMDETTIAVIPAGSVLGVARIYIRTGAKDFDSLTFRLYECPGRPDFAIKKHKGTRTGGGLRFYAKLADVNRIEAEVVE